MFRAGHCCGHLLHTDICYRLTTCRKSRDVALHTSMPYGSSLVRRWSGSCYLSSFADFRNSPSVPDSNCSNSPRLVGLGHLGQVPTHLIHLGLRGRGWRLCCALSSSISMCARILCCRRPGLPGLSTMHRTMGTMHRTMAVLALPSGLWLALCRHVLDLSRPNMVHVSLKVHWFPFGLSNFSMSSSHSSSLLRHVAGRDIVMHLAFRGRGLCRGALHGICDWQAPDTTRACTIVCPSPCCAWPGWGTAIQPAHIVVLLVASRVSTLNSSNSRARLGGRQLGRDCIAARVDVVRINLPDDALLLF